MPYCGSNVGIRQDEQGCFIISVDGQSFRICPGSQVSCAPNGLGIMIDGELCPFPSGGGGEEGVVTNLSLNTNTFVLTLSQSNGPDVPVDLSALASDFYADGISFDDETRELTITRTGGLDPLSVEIPSDAQFPDTGTPYFLLQRGAAGGVLTEGRLFLGTMSSTPLPDDAIIMPGVPDGSPDTSAFRRAVATTAPTARTVAKRTADGTLKAADAVEPDDLVTLGQLPPPFELPAGTEWQVLQRDGDGEPVFDSVRPNSFFPGYEDFLTPNRGYLYGFFVNPDGSIVFNPQTVGQDPNVSAPINQVPSYQSVTVSIGPVQGTWRFLRAHTPPDGRDGSPAPYEDEILVNKGYLNERLASGDGMPLEWLISPTAGSFSFPEHQRPVTDYEASVAVGIEAMAIHTNPGANQGACGAFGFGAYANGLHAIAAGTQSVAGPASWDGSNWIREPEETGLMFPAAFGNRAIARADQTLALGHRSVAGHLRGVALGAQSETGAADEVSVGNDTLKRRIANVNDPTNEWDAVNRRALFEHQSFYGSVQTSTQPVTNLDVAGEQHNPDAFQSISYTNSTLYPQILKCEVVFREQYELHGNGRIVCRHQFKFNGGSWGTNQRPEERRNLPVDTVEVSSDREVYFPTLEVAPGDTVTLEARVTVLVTDAFEAGSTLTSHVQINALAVPAVLQPLDPGPPNDWVPPALPPQNLTPPEIAPFGDPM